MLRRLLDPKSDFAFKKVFGTEKNRDILVKFLNDMLDFRDKEPIVEIILQQTILDAQTPSLKSGVLDILCKDACGNSYIIEMQAQGNKDDFGKRAEFYASKAYFNQLRIGEDYKTLKQVFFLGVLNFSLFPNIVPYKSEHFTTEKTTNEIFMNGHSYVFLELPKFIKKQEDLPLLETEVEKWAYFFKYADTMSALEWEQFVSNSTIFNKVYKNLDQASWSDNERLIYDDYQKKVMDFSSIMEGKLNEGIAEGEARGEARGEAKAKIETAQKLLAKGFSVEDVCDVTGLSIDEINDTCK